MYDAIRKRGGYICTAEEGEKIREVLFPNNGPINKDVVGQSVQKIAKAAGINVPEGSRVILVEAKGPGKEDCICREKMCPVMCLLSYNHFEEGVELACTNLAVEGNGHSCAIHSNNQAHIILTGSRVTVSRIVVNAPSATTAGGHIQNGLNVTNTLGCGSWGNNSISENFTYKHLMNISRIAPLNPAIKVPNDKEIWEL